MNITKRTDLLLVISKTQIEYNKVKKKIWKIYQRKK